ncbi:MAG: hypothetical protein LBI36_07560 [Oscillospiraceae bacterium]|jgi:hypothetical protein|nr:hypothetical protein [Oscillospiraceae bacterium]
MKKNLPRTAVFFAFALPFLIVVRYLQYSTVISPVNGFFEPNGGFLNVAYYVFFAVFVVAAAVLAALDKKSGRGVGKVIIARMGGACSDIGGMLTAFTCFLFAYETGRLFVGEGGFFAVFMFFLATAGYALTAFAIFKYRRLLPVTGFSLLLLTVFYVLGAAVEFMARINITSISARLVILLANVALALFFLSCGRIFMRLGTKLTPVLTAVYGYSAAMLIFSDGAARLVHIAALDKGAYGFLVSGESGFSVPNTVFFSQGAVVLWLIFALSVRNRKRKSDENPE